MTTPDELREEARAYREVRNAEIFRRYVPWKISLAFLAREYGITRQAVFMIVKREKRKQEYAEKYAEREGATG